MFGALESASPDPNDAATKTCTPPPGRDYTKFLKADGLKGARIGIPRKNYYEAFDPPVVRPERRPRRSAGGGRGGGRGGLNPEQTKVMDEAIAALKAAGAIVIDVDIPSMLVKDPKENLLTAGQSSVLNYGMKRDFNAWLASLGPAAPVKSLTELREWNTAHERLGAIKYGQSQLDASDQIDLEKDRAKYEEDRARDIRVFGTNGIDAAMKANNLDALLFPGPGERRHRVEAGLPDRARAVRHDSESRNHLRRRRPGRSRRRRPRRRRSGSPTAPPPLWVRSEATAVRGWVYRGRVQRAEVAAAGVCVRAGDEEENAATRPTLTKSRTRSCEGESR